MLNPSTGFSISGHKRAFLSTCFFAKPWTRLKTRRIHLALLCFLISELSLSGNAFAAVQRVQGIVFSPAQTPIASATVSIENVTTHAKRSTSTDVHGGFLFASLSEGSYAVSVEASGWQALQRRFVLARGPVAGVNLTIHLRSNTSSEEGSAAPSFQIRAANPIDALTAGTGARTTTAPHAAGRALKTGASQASLTAGTNAPADFSIYAPVIAKAPQRFGYNTALAVGPTNNAWILTDGTNPYDARLALTATDDGSDTTFIATNANGNPGTDFYQSVITGYFVGAFSHVYRFTNNAWTLVRTGTVTGYTAVVGSNAIADHTITFDTSGPATKAGDVIWLAHDDVPALPDANELYLRSADYSTYYPDWQTETNKGWKIGTPAPYTLDTDVPPSDPTGLSAKISDTNTEVQGFTQYTGFFQCPNSEVFELGKTYRLGVWLKQQGIADSTVTVSITQFNISHAFTVTDQWQYFTFDFAAPACLPANSVIVGHRLDYNAPGTLWENGLTLSNIDTPAFSLDPRVQQAWNDYKGSTMRIWSNFGDSSGGYGFWSLDSWLLPENKARSNPGIGNYYENRESQGHLPEALREAKVAGVNPWLIVSMSLSADEWSKLVEYLAAPAGVGYAAKRPADHPGPYTDDFQQIYLEVGNEEWGTQQVPVNFAYGQWVHYVATAALADKSYVNPAQFQFVANGFFLQPSFGSAAATQAPEASYVDYALYNSGDQTLTGDAYFQSDLIQLPATNQALIDNIVAAQKVDAANGHPYKLAAYEAGPGQDTPIHQGDTSLAAAVANLDVDLYASLRGFDLINYFLFNLGSGPYSSHSRLTDGLRPHPAWQAMQMRNAYAAGDMVWTVPNSVPTTADSNKYPLIGVYTFRDQSNGGDQADVIVLSRDLVNATPVTLHFPGTPSGSGNLYTLTGDPRANNDDALHIPIGTQTLSGLTKDYTFSMPPGSVYIFQVPIVGGWATQIPAPFAPQNLQATADNGKVILTWVSVDGASTYNVKRSTTKGGPYTTVAASTGPGYTDAGVINGTTYYYVVTAANTGGESPASNEVVATPNVANAPITTTTPPLDGTDTGAWANVPALPLSHDFNTYTPDTATYKTLWDANYLYVLATVQDTTPAISTGPYAAFNGDSVEIYFSGTQNKSNAYGPTDFQYAFPYGTTAVLESKHNALTGVLFGQTTVAGGYQMAMAIPWTTLGTTPIPGKQYGFDVMVNDATSPNTRIGKLAWWATRDFTYSDPSLMGPLQLSATGTLPGSSTSLTISPTSGFVSNQPWALTAVVAPSEGNAVPTGTVTFKVDGPAPKSETERLDKTGKAVHHGIAPPFGSYNVTATYNGSTSLAGSVSPAVPEVVTPDPVTATLTVGPGATFLFGQTWTLTTTLTSQTGTPVNVGTVTFAAGPFTKVVKVGANGTATFTGPVPGAGTYTVQAAYSGSKRFGPNTAPGVPVTIQPTSTTTVVSIAPTSGLAYGAPWQITANVSSASGAVPPGKVTFTLSGASQRTYTATINKAGTATVSTTVPIDGSYSLTAAYGAAANFGGSTSAPLVFSVSGKATATKTVLTQSPSTILIAGQPWTLTAVVTPKSGTVVPDGSVTFSWNGGSAVVPVDTTGNAVYNGTVPAVGAHTVSAKYTGSPAFAASTSNTISFVSQGSPTTTTLSVNPSGSVVTGSSLTLTAVVAQTSGTILPTGSITFSIGSVTAKVAVDATGKAVYTTTAPSPGSYSVIAAYSGSSAFAASTSSAIDETVTGVSTTTALSINPPTGIVSGQSLTLTATVTPGSGNVVPTGNVTFTIGTSTAVIALDGTGKAVYTTPAPTPGTYNISAVYAGTTTFLTSSSSATSISVAGSPTSTTLAVAPALTVTAGQSITLSATVAATGGGATPSGNVTFTLGNTTQTAALNANGVASFTGPAPAAGSYPVTAAFAGSGPYSASSSAAVTLTVVALGTPLPIAIPDYSFETNPQRYSVPTGWNFASLPGTQANYCIADTTSYAIEGIDGTSSWSPGCFNPATNPPGSSTALLTTASSLGTFTANTEYQLTVAIEDPVDGVGLDNKAIGFELLADGQVVSTYYATGLVPGAPFADFTLPFYTSSHPEVVGKNITVGLIYTWSGNYNRGVFFDNVRLAQTYGTVDPGIATTTTLAIAPSNTVTTGDAFILTATVAPASGNVVPSGTVLFTIGSATQTVSLGNNGVATYNGTAPAVGTYNVTAAYSGFSGTPSFASSASAPATLTVKPLTGVGPVTGLTVTGGDGLATLAWTAASNALSYNVYEGTSAGGENATPVQTGISGTAAVITGLTNGTTYYFTVQGANGTIVGSPSNEVSVTPLAPPPANPPLAYEPFDVPTGALQGVSDGSGWAKNWVEQTGSTDIPGYNVANGTPLSYTGLATTGNYAVGGFAYQASGRALDISAGGPFASYLNGGLIGAPGTVLYASFLIRKDSNDTQPDWVALHNSPIEEIAGSSQVAAGYFGDGSTAYWSLNVNGTITNSARAVSVGTTTLLVVKVAFGSTNIISLYVNPTPGTEPSTADATATTSNLAGFRSLAWLGGYGPNSASLDEIRIGAAFADVTPSH